MPSFVVIGFPFRIVLLIWPSITKLPRSSKKGEAKREEEEEEEEGVDKSKVFVFDDLNTPLPNDYFLDPCECFNEDWAGRSDEPANKRFWLWKWTDALPFGMSCKLSRQKCKTGSQVGWQALTLWRKTYGRRCLLAWLLEGSGVLFRCWRKPGREI